MQAPHGPFKISRNRQVTIPAELMRQLDLAPGDSVYVVSTADSERSLVLLPVEVVVSWLETGRRLSRSDPVLPDDLDETRS